MRRRGAELEKLAGDEGIAGEVAADGLGMDLEEMGEGRG